jgi:GxxExxY protein
MLYRKAILVVCGQRVESGGILSLCLVPGLSCNRRVLLLGSSSTPWRKDAKMVEPSPEHDLLASRIVDAAFAVHTALGPGLLESVYEQCLVYELETRGIPFQRQVALPIRYRDKRIDAGYRLDLIVGGLVVLEIKAIEKILPVHEAQLMIYLKLSGHRLGLLINFNVALIKFGIKRRASTT